MKMLRNNGGKDQRHGRHSGIGSWHSTATKCRDYNQIVGAGTPGDSGVARALQPCSELGSEDTPPEYEQGQA